MSFLKNRGLLITVISSLFGLGSLPMEWKLSTGLGMLSLLGAAVGAVIQYRDAQPFVMEFVESDWQQVGQSFHLNVPRSLHRKSAPVIRTFAGEKGMLEECWGSNFIDSNTGTATVRASRGFRGRIQIN